MSQQSLARQVKFLMVAFLASVALVAAGCGGDNPSRLAETIDPQARPGKPIDAKSAIKEKTESTNRNR